MPENGHVDTARYSDKIFKLPGIGKTFSEFKPMDQDKYFIPNKKVPDVAHLTCDCGNDSSYRISLCGGIMVAVCICGIIFMLNEDK